jgi:hypothetical protein
MATGIIGGIHTWSMTRDDEGHREYKATFLVGSTDADNGPATVLATPGLPQPGDPWAYGNDVDPWAWCRQNVSIKPHQGREGEWVKRWVLEYTWSSKPTKRCNDTQFDNPLDEPDKISFDNTTSNLEATHDRFGNPIQNSAFEQLRGPQTEFQWAAINVRIEQNVADLQMALLCHLVNRVNGDTLWGLLPRTVLFAKWSAERKYHGSCFVYWTRTLEFQVDAGSSGWDRDILDEGTKALNGHWGTANSIGTGSGTGTGGQFGWILDEVNGGEPDPNNPAHFIRVKDLNGENMRVILDGSGVPVNQFVIEFSTELGTGSGTGTVIESEPGNIHVEYYREGDFTQLGIPTEFEIGTGSG